VNGTREKNFILPKIAESEVNAENEEKAEKVPKTQKM
jgi:hypothetical protein